MTLQDLRKKIRQELESAGIADAQSETFQILEYTLGIDRGRFFTEPSRDLGEELPPKLAEVLKKRKKRIPLQYIMGTCEFMGLSFHVDERVLIPRQDTECLVEEVLEDLKKRPDREACRVLDLCCGSGCIGISIGKLCPGTRLTLADLSADALNLAEDNAKRLGLEAEFVQGDLFENIKDTYDYIVSNPPYIPTGVIDTLMEEVKDHEPRTALDGMEDGLEFYRRITAQAGKYLNKGGALFLEIGYDQGKAVSEQMRDQGFSQVKVVCDLAGLDRVVRGVLE